MGICRDSRHKRRATGGKRFNDRKKRKFELGRPPTNTKIGVKKVSEVRTRGGNKKFRALRLESGNYSWGSEVCTRKTRVLDVVYNASNNELVRTKTLVKNAIVQIDATCACPALPHAPYHICLRRVAGLPCACTRSSAGSMWCTRLCLHSPMFTRGRMRCDPSDSASACEV